MAPKLLSFSCSLIPALAMAFVAAPARADGPSPFVKIRELAPDFYTHAQICADARTTGKGLALVAMKSHSCDLDEKQHCMKETYYLSDPCDAAVQENFAVYHLRGQRNVRFPPARESDWTQDAQAALVKEWGGTAELEPEWILLDPKSCTEIRRLKRGKDEEPSELHTPESHAPGGVLSGSQIDRAALTDEYQFLAQELSRAIGPGHRLAHAFNRTKTEACLSAPERSTKMTLFDLWDFLDSQHAKPAEQQP